MAKDEDADDDDPTELQEVQGVQGERPQGAIVHHCCYGANGPRACQFSWNGSHRRDQKEASGTEDTGGD